MKSFTGKRVLCHPWDCQVGATVSSLALGFLYLSFSCGCRKGGSQLKSWNKWDHTAIMRKPEVVPPPMVVISECDSDGDSTVSMSEHPLHLPQHDMKSFGTRTEHPGHRIQRIAKKRILGRSPQLQSALDRIELRTSEPSPPRRYQEIELDPVEHVEDMFSTYDVVLDHLVKKNKNLKSYVRYKSNRFPSELSYTSSEVIDTLESLRRERANSLGPLLGRRAMSQPRPLREDDSSMWKDQYNTQQDMYRNRLGPRVSRTDDFFIPSVNQDEDRESMKHIDFTSERLMTGNRGQQYPIARRQESTSDYRRQTQDLLRVMEGFKKDETIDPFQIRGRFSRGGHLPQNIGTKVEGYGRDLQRQKIERHVGHVSRETRGLYKPSHSVGRVGTRQDRWDNLDPIEMTRSMEDGGDHDPSHSKQCHGYTDERDSLVITDRGECKMNSEKLSRLLPEKIPPKIKASRDRLALFRRSRLKPFPNGPKGTLEHEWRNDTPPRRLESLLRRRDDTRQAEETYPTGSRYRTPNTGKFRPGSPERPFNISDIDQYEMRFGTKPPSGQNGEFFSSKSIYTMEESPSPRPVMDLYSGHIENSNEESTMAPSEKARQLMSHVDDVYRFSKKLCESNKKMKDELSRIKQIYVTRSDSLNEIYYTQKRSLNERSAEQVTLPSAMRADASPRGDYPPAKNTNAPLPAHLSIDPSQYRPRQKIFPVSQQHRPFERKEYLTSRATLQESTGTPKGPFVPDRLTKVQNSTPINVMHPPRFSFAGTFVDNDDPVPTRARVENNKNLGMYDKSLISCSTGGSSSQGKKNHQSDNLSDSEEEEPPQITRAKKVLFQDPIILPERRQRGACC